MMKYYIALAFSILTQCTGLILLKKGMVAKYAYGSLNRIGAWLGLFTNIYVLLGVFFFVVSLILWMFILIKIDLSLAYPTVSSSYVILAIASHYLFNEEINIYRWLGIGIIIIGIFVMYRK